MNARHDKTLKDIFTVPTSATILFSAVLSLLKALGATVTSGKGSHYKVLLRDRIMILPRPHGKKKTVAKYFVEQLRDVLEKLGIVPKDAA